MRRAHCVVARAYRWDLLALTVSLTDADHLQKGIAKEKNWRYGYDEWMLKVYEAQVLQCAKDKQVALQSLNAGLEAATDLEFERPNGSIVPLKEEMACEVSTLSSITIIGTGASVTELIVPYKGADLSGDALQSQLGAWSDYGCMEPDCAAAIQRGVNNVASIKGQSFVVLGATSELGPLKKLLQCGATVYAVGRKGWAELIAFARTTAGTLVIPVTGNPSTDDEIVAAAGADLIKDPAAAKTWILSCINNSPGKVVIGTYLYADSDLNVRITAVAEVIIAAAAALGKDKVGFAWLGSFAVAHIIPEIAAEAQLTGASRMSWWQRATGRSLYREPLEFQTGKAHVYKGYATFQGPNYALAQHMRQWRAMLMSDQGFVVSSPMAPPCRTESVVHNATAAIVLEGMSYFPPSEVFDAETANGLLFGLLVSGLTTPATPVPSPFHIFTRTHFGGGQTRMPYDIGSRLTGVSLYLLGKLCPQKYPSQANNSKLVVVGAIVLLIAAGLSWRYGT